MMLYGLSDENLKQIVDVLSANPKIEELILFGSRAKGNYSNGSDIDIAMIGKELKICDVTNALVLLDDLFLPYQFDLIIFSHIKEPALIDHINTVGISLYKRRS